MRLSDTNLRLILQYFTVKSRFFLFFSFLFSLSFPFLFLFLFFSTVTLPQNTLLVSLFFRRINKIQASALIISQTDHKIVLVILL